MIIRWICHALALWAACCTVLSASASASGAPTLGPASLPGALLIPPPFLDPASQHIPLAPAGSLPQLRRRPRVLVGYVSAKRWAFIEFLCMAHASWSHLVALPASRLLKVDLLVFVDPYSAENAAALCSVIDLDAPAGTPGSYEAALSPNSQCLAVVYPVPPAHIWHDYPYINNVHFFADPRVAALMRRHYGYAMKTDWDVFFSPALLNHFPEQFDFGVQEYVLLPATSQRLQRVATDLGLTYRGHHNIGPTWYGPVDTLLAIGNLSIPVLHHILTHEFEQLPGGGVAQRYLEGEGWPQWNAGIAAMYATEVLVNGLMANGTYRTTPQYDSHGDSDAPTMSVYHIHCRHGDGDFSKFEFLSHHYDRLTDLGGLNPAVVKDYAMRLAVQTWRQLMALTSGTGGAGGTAARGGAVAHGQNQAVMQGSAGAHEEL